MKRLAAGAFNLASGDESEIARLSDLEQGKLQARRAGIERQDSIGHLWRSAAANSAGSRLFGMAAASRQRFDAY